VQAPPSNVVVVILLLIGMLSAAHYAVLKQRKTEYNDKLIKMVQANAGPAQGGTREVCGKYFFLLLPILGCFLFCARAFF